jgi:hypothetical protein
VLFTEIRAEEAPAQHREHFTDNNLIGRLGEPVSTGLAAGAFDEFPQAQNAHELCDIGGRKPFGPADFRNRQATSRLFLLASDLEEATESIFFLGA